MRLTVTTSTWALLLLPIVSSTAMAQRAGAAETRQPANRRGTDLVLEVSGECPARDAIRRALDPLLGPAQTKVPQSERRTLSARVTDRGPEFEVAAAAQVATYLDQGRDCDERARVAAVFIALAFFPPASQVTLPPALPPTAPRVEPLPPAGAPAAPEAPSPPPTTPPSPSSALFGTASGPSYGRAPEGRDTWWVALSAGMRLDGAPGVGLPDGPTFGGELWATAGRGRFGLFASAAALADNVSRRATVRVHQRRFPLAIGATAQHTSHDGWRAGMDLGVAAAPFTLRGEDLLPSTPERRVDIGARAALHLRLPLFAHRWAAALAVHADYFPRVYVVQVDPVGRIGSSSELWIGASARVWYQLR